MNFVVESEGNLVTNIGEEKKLKKGDFAFAEPNEKHQYRNIGKNPFIMVCGVPKAFE